MRDTKLGTSQNVRHPSRQGGQWMKCAKGSLQPTGSLRVTSRQWPVTANPPETTATSCVLRLGRQVSRIWAPLQFGTRNTIAKVQKYVEVASVVHRHDVCSSRPPVKTAFALCRKAHQTSSIPLTRCVACPRVLLLPECVGNHPVSLRHSHWSRSPVTMAAVLPETYEWGQCCVS